MLWQPADFLANSDWGHPSLRRMGTTLIIEYAANEPVLIQALLPQPAIKGLHRGVPGC